MTARLDEFIKDLDKNWNDDIQEIWITKGIKTDAPILWAFNFARYLVTDDATDQSGTFNVRDAGLSTTKLYTHYNELLRIRERARFDDKINDDEYFMETIYIDLLNMHPSLARSTAREKNNIREQHLQKFVKIQDLEIQFVNSLKFIKSMEHFSNFFQIFEAIVNYHKVHALRLKIDRK